MVFVAVIAGFGICGADVGVIAQPVAFKLLESVVQFRRDGPLGHGHRVQRTE